MSDDKQIQNKLYTKRQKYVPLNERLQELKTRLDVPEYNEQQQLLFQNDCTGLTKDIYKKVCRFITDCEVPDTDVCLVNINYKETIPPSHPREELPINLLASLQTCCEPGRIACPELIMYSIEPESSVEDMMLYTKKDVGLGPLQIGIDFKNRVHCCDSVEDPDLVAAGIPDFDFIEVLPSLQLDFSCEYGSLEFSGEYLESIELCYKRLEFLRKYRIWMDLCARELSFEADVTPVSEECLACDTSYEIAAETSVENACGNLTVKVKKNVLIDWCSPEFKEEFSIELSQECCDPQSFESITEAEVFCLHGCYLKYKLKEKVFVNWCSGEISIEPELSAECKCNPIESPPTMFPINIAIPGCQSGGGHSVNLSGSGTVKNTLQPNGTISSSVSVGEFSSTGELGPDASVAFVQNIELSKDETKLLIHNASMIFSNGIFCRVQESPLPQEIPLDKFKFDCERLRRECKFCECSDSSSSSPSESSSSNSGSSSSSSYTIHSDSWSWSTVCVGDAVTIIDKATYDSLSQPIYVKYTSCGSTGIAQASVEQKGENQYLLSIIVSCDKEHISDIHDAKLYKDGSYSYPVTFTLDPTSVQCFDDSDSRSVS